MRFLAILVIALCYAAAANGNRVRSAHQNRWLWCPAMSQDFGFLDTDKTQCNSDFIFDAIFIHNNTGDFALIPQVYKTKKFAVHQPLGVSVSSLCSNFLDEEVHCIFANKTSFSTMGEKINLDPSVKIVRDSCNKQVVEKCKATWEGVGTMPTMASCPKLLLDFPPLENSKLLCDHDYIIESLFVHNATGDYVLVHNNHKARRALLAPTTRIPVHVPASCKGPIDEELFCIFANSRDFSADATGTLRFSNQITLVKKPCSVALVNRCLQGSWNFARHTTGRF